MKTAIRCCEFDDVLDVKSIYSLLCLASLKNGYFELCSSALIKVKNMNNI
jgi:hypothetical protein